MALAVAVARQALVALAVDAPPAASDGATILCFAALFPILRFVLEKAVFRRTALYFVGKTEAARARARAKLKGEKAEKKEHAVDTATKLPLKVVKKVEKFCESCWKLFVYASFSALLVAAIGFSSPTDSYASWLLDDKLMWIGLPGHQHVTLALKGIYLLELSFYVVAMPTLLFWETRRKDFNIMFCHHVVTILLIGFSFFFNYSRVGSAIMLLHDICDIFLEAGEKQYVLQTLTISSQKPLSHVLLSSRVLRLTDTFGIVVRFLELIRFLSIYMYVLPRVCVAHI